LHKTFRQTTLNIRKQAPDKTLNTKFDFKANRKTTHPHHHLSTTIMNTALPHNRYLAVDHATPLRKPGPFSARLALHAEFTAFLAEVDYPNFARPFGKAELQPL
jgi:hypothetical protein